MARVGGGDAAVLARGGCGARDKEQDALVVHLLAHLAREARGARALLPRDHQLEHALLHAAGAGVTVAGRTGERERLVQGRRAPRLHVLGDRCRDVLVPAAPHRALAPHLLVADRVFELTASLLLSATVCGQLAPCSLH